MTMKDVAFISKKQGEELQQYLYFKRRGFTVQAKKGKGSYSRKQKHLNMIKGVYENG